MDDEQQETSAGELLLSVVEALGVSREGFLSMTPEAAVEAARAIKEQGEALASLPAQLDAANYRGDVALAVLSSLVEAVRPVLQGLATDQEREEAGRAFSDVYQALAESRRAGDLLDPDEAIQRLQGLVVDQEQS